MVIGRLTAARIAVLPFAPALWLYAWVALSLVRRRPRARSQLVISGQVLIVTAGFVGLLYAQFDVYRRMTGIWAPGNDNYFFTLFVAEVIVMIFVVSIWARKKYKTERSGAAR